MAGSEFIQKMLRAVLQSSKDGVSIESLQYDYRSLCGETIPHRKLGFSQLEDYLRSIPSVVRMSYVQGQLRCFAGVCEQTAHIAELVARQKSSKKSGRSQLVNCRMRFRSSDPFMSQNMKARSSLRQPSARSASSFPFSNPRPHGGFRGCSSAGDYRQMDQRFMSSTPVQHRPPPAQLGVTARVDTKRYFSERTVVNEKPKEKPFIPSSDRRSPAQTGVYDVEQMKQGVAIILKRYSCGLWISKLPDVYRQMFEQTLHPRVLNDLENWTDVCMVEQSLSSNRLLFPPSPPKSSSAPQTNGRKSSSSSSSSKPSSSSTPARQHPLLASPPSSEPRDDPQIRTRVPEPSPLDGSPVNLVNGAASSPAVVSAEVRARLKELLLKYSHGLWAHALPKLFMDTYKTPFPTEILDNVSLLLEICSVEYPNPKDRSKAILYDLKKPPEAEEDPETEEDPARQSRPLPSGVTVLGPVIPDSLVLPSEGFSSVLVTETMSGNTVTVRFIGEKYSHKLENMEENMCSFYGRTSIHRRPSNLSVGQLVAVWGEDGEVSRAQVVEILSKTNKFKIYYVDDGFFLEADVDRLLDLHPDFCTLPFQATNVQLAGLETFSSHPSVLSSLDELAVGKILLIETLDACQRTGVTQAVLYDTSQDEDVNINSTCLKALRQETMNDPLIVDAVIERVCVTNACSDGNIYCRLPSRGTARLEKLLVQTEAFFTAHTTLECLVSRPFAGKFCLARCRGEWSRVEITTLYANIVVEVYYMDLGLSATIEVTHLREFPPVFTEEFLIIPPQAIKCRLASVDVPGTDWAPEVVVLLKKALVGVPDCKLKIQKLEREKGETLVHVHLFVGVDCREPEKSFNHQLVHSKMWQQLLSKNESSGEETRSHQSNGSEEANKMVVSDLPPTMELPQPGQNLDVFVPVACHPGHFVLQRWQDNHKLVVLMGEMMLHYNRAQESSSGVPVQKGGIYAAKIDKTWRRALVKGTLANGLISVYDLDYGMHEIVRDSSMKPLIEGFRQLPFQAVVARLAGVKQQTWSEEATMLFRSHVEKKALVAQVESVQDWSEVKGEPWVRRLTVYLVDTGVEDQDLWIHSILHNIDSELSSAA